MLFDSAVYPVSLALVALIYWRLPLGAQNRFLLVASYCFYGWWDWRFLILMIASTAIDYHLATAIAASDDPRRKRGLLAAALSVNLGALAYFKYSNFFLDSLHISHGFLNIILPPAISFYTFQEVAYLVDVYRGRLAPARSFVEYALFIGFFPHLIAGPIQRPDDPEMRHRGQLCGSRERRIRRTYGRDWVRRADRCVCICLADLWRFLGL
jgi:D-alanyl-lipoteichoic acid acyltransferase DltB (MBOAT superfamily)